MTKEREYPDNQPLISVIFKAKKSPGTVSMVIFLVGHRMLGGRSAPFWTINNFSKLLQRERISCRCPFYPVPDYLPRGGVAGGRVSGQHAAAQSRQGESCRHPSGLHRQRPVILVHSIFVIIFV